MKIDKNKNIIRNDLPKDGHKIYLGFMNVSVYLLINLINTRGQIEKSIIIGWNTERSIKCNSTIYANLYH